MAASWTTYEWDIETVHLGEDGEIEIIDHSHRDRLHDFPAEQLISAINNDAEDQDGTFTRLAALPRRLRHRHLRRAKALRCGVQSMSNVTITIRADDAEPFLRSAAKDAAKYGAWYYYITNRTYRSPASTSRSFDADRKAWKDRYYRAKRIVEAFGVEVEDTSEEETLTVTFPQKNEKRKRVNVGGVFSYIRVEGGEPDYSKPIPMYRSGVHADACAAAADRVVRRWREGLACRS